MPTRSDGDAVPVSVLLPTRDRPDTLGAVLDALKGQDTRGLAPELVVVDNGSQPATRALAADLVGAFPWPARLLDEPRPGVAAARNAAVAAAAHDRVVLLNDDVVPRTAGWLRGHVERLRAAEDEGEAVVLGPVTWHPAVDRTPVMAWLEDTGKSHSYARCRRGESAPGELYANNLSLRRGTLTAAGGFDEALAEYGWEEYDLGLRLHDRGVRIRFAPELEAWHHHRYDLRASLAREEHVGASAVRFAARHPGRALDTPRLPAWAVRAGALAYVPVRRAPLPEALPRPALRLVHRLALASGMARAGRAERAA